VCAANAARTFIRTDPKLRMQPPRTISA